jgi:hypothetical protein
VAVKLVTSSTTAKAYATWMSATAIATINALTATGGTPTRRLSTSNGHQWLYRQRGQADRGGVQNVSYFITDGVPTAGGRCLKHSRQLGGLCDGAPDQLRGRGFGGILEKDIPNIDPIAYNGAEGKENRCRG